MKEIFFYSRLLFQVVCAVYPRHSGASRNPVRGEAVLDSGLRRNDEQRFFYNSLKVMKKRKFPMRVNYNVARFKKKVTDYYKKIFIAPGCNFSAL